MLPAREAGLTNGDYAFIMFELDQDRVLFGSQYPSWWFSVSTDPRDPYYRCKFQNAFNSVLVIALKAYVKKNQEAFTKFERTVRARSPEPPFYSDAFIKTPAAYVSCYLTFVTPSLSCIINPSMPPCHCYKQQTNPATNPPTSRRPSDQSTNQLSSQPTHKPVDKPTDNPTNIGGLGRGTGQVNV